jgi:hypothetical protein
MPEPALAPPQSLRLPDLGAVPDVGSRDRNAHEEAALARGRELIHECGGRIREALFELEQELRGLHSERPSRQAYAVAMVYARELVSYVEGCWSTAILR